MILIVYKWTVFDDSSSSIAHQELLRPSRPTMRIDLFYSGKVYKSSAADADIIKVFRHHTRTSQREICAFQRVKQRRKDIAVSTEIRIQRVYLQSHYT